jgi:antitoxin MazE
MKATIQKWGNSQAIRLPKTILETAQLGENEPVQIFAERDKIIIRKAAAMKHRTLAERLAGFEGDYTGQEWDTGAPVGKEVW